MEAYNFIRTWLRHSNDCHHFDFLEHLKKGRIIFIFFSSFEFSQIECVESIVPCYTILDTSAMMYNSEAFINCGLHK